MRSWTAEVTAFGVVVRIEHVLTQLPLGSFQRSPTDIALSTALIYAGIPDHPEGHDMLVQSVRIFALQK
jgi:hypothetical protein